MARPLRIEYEGAFYHITARGNERKRIYFGRADFEMFVNRLGEDKSLRRKVSEIEKEMSYVNGLTP